LIKLTVPGVPDTYQGNELWEFNLVDPDNRRAVDYGIRGRILQEFREMCDKNCDQLATFVREIADDMSDGRIKLYLIWKVLNLRKQRPELFQEGEYIPLEIAGKRAKHLLAFARRHENETLIVAVPRLFAQLLGGDPRMPSGEEIWQDTRIEVPGQPTSFGNLLTGELLSPAENGAYFTKDLFNSFPVGLLVSEAAPIS
jgi:(1->4)-alpha-D-glucan 1-alpha-D-glucosylmutase